MAKSIMIQGTTSGAGKSLLAAGLCRILRQDGYRVAPFKSQNMALNSCITTDGLEMGRAQAVQAEAAGISPTVLMNPVLLKPSSDTGSQVIVCGEVMGHMAAADYFRYKKQLFPKILDCYEHLCAQYDIIVIEGAGSPAEINLKNDDIVNMGLAKRVQAPVLLAGDIDRGGVFASLYGTLALLEEEERALVKGLIINKFRGDQKILAPGLTMLEELTHKKVLGVVPLLPVDIDEEDSLTDRFSAHTGGLIDIAVVRLPRISNFTDFNPLSVMQEVGLRYVKNPSELGRPDLIILPGTKNTMEDLRWMRQNGLEAAIQKCSASGTPVFGICGGYQMLGQTLSDPAGVESGGECAGLGLLPLRTVFEEQKVRTRVTAAIGTIPGIFSGLSGLTAEGYEIHMGHTARTGPVCCLCTLAAADSPASAAASAASAASAVSAALGSCTQKNTPRQDGAAQGNVYGTYLHGFFDRAEIAQTIVSALLKAKGLSAAQAGTCDAAVYRQHQYDLLADGLRASLDMKRLYQIIEEGA